MTIKEVSPRWKRLGFASEEDMNRHGANYQHRKAQKTEKEAEK